MPVVTEDDAPVEQRGARNRPLLHPLRTPDLCRNFIEQMVARGMVIAARRQPHSGVPEVDWTSIWSKGEGALSAEQAIGSIVAEAFITARDLSGGTDELFGPMVPQREVAPAQRPPPDLPSAQHRVDLSFARGRIRAAPSGTSAAAGPLCAVSGGRTGGASGRTPRRRGASRPP